MPAYACLHVARSQVIAVLLVKFLILKQILLKHMNLNIVFDF
jgi:hypothetical protein